ncbi:TetR/AcrR family transcriptional regulator [Bifidobacterium margollesii]|nr:TetR/AcrR family transcriptional regulator [Bifidobacterium margollesii]
MDRRTRRTRSHLLSALIDLLETKPLNRITVTELTERADINRATFYAHYRNVDELFDELKIECCAMFRELVIRHAEEIRHDDTSGIVRELFEYFNEHERMFTLLSRNGDDTIYADIVTELQTALTDTVLPLKRLDRKRRCTFDRNDPAEMALFAYQFDFISGGLVSMLQRWFTNGRRESVETMATIADNDVNTIGPGLFETNLAVIAAEYAEHDPQPGQGDAEPGRGDR